MLRNFFTTPEDARMAYLESLVEETLDEQRQMVEYRKYYAGEHEIKLTERQKDFLKAVAGDKFRQNVCPLVVESLVERLALSGFEDLEQRQEADSEEAVSGQQPAGLVEFASKLWEENRMDAGQKEIYRQAGIDQVTYVVLDIDPLTGQITLNHNDGFTSSKAGGDNEGVKLHYANGHRRGRPMFATKRWAVQQGEGAGYRRYWVVYYTDRIERYYQDDREPDGGRFGEAGWKRDVPREGPLVGVWPQPWIDALGQPLGIPVVGFPNGRASELHEVVPLQRALNKALIDLVAAADEAGFGVLFAAGWIPTSDGRPIITDSSGKITSGNQALKKEPGTIFYTQDPEGKLSRVPGEDLDKLIRVVDRHTLSIAQVSRTPISNFQLFGQIPGEGTQRQLESGLLAKAEDRHLGYGNSWEDLIYLAARMAAGAPLFSEGQIVGHGLPQYQEFGLGESRLGAIWQEAETRNEKEHLETLEIKQRLGVPDEQIFLEMGYTADQAAKFAREKARQRAAGLERLIETGAAGSPPNPPEGGEGNRGQGPGTGEERSGGQGGNRTTGR